MSLHPPICGIETEYGLWVEGEGAAGQRDTALALLERCPLEPRVPWYDGDETPGRDARWPEPGPAVAAGTGNGDHPGYMLRSGGRLYVDHGHPEYSTPECAEPLDLVASDKAGERLLDRCRRELHRFLPLHQRIRLFKNNSDHRGNSYGCHESYLLDATLYEDLFRRGEGSLTAHLVPFLVSRIVICGAGKVGSEHGRSPVPYQLSQRADFLERVLGLETTCRRPLINTRDEAHADRRRFARLHLICGDANMSGLSSFLKIGTTQLLLASLGRPGALPDLTLREPLLALRTISRDPSLQARVPLADGRRLTAVELQMAFAEAIAPHAAEAGGAWAEVAIRWREVLDGLARDPEELGRSLDWAIKLRLLEGWRRRKGLAWSSPVLEELDVRYHDIDPQGLFSLLQARGEVETLIDDDRVAAAMEEPPAPTRAAWRADLILGPKPPAALSWAVAVHAGAAGELFEEHRDPRRSDPENGG